MHITENFKVEFLYEKHEILLGHLYKEEKPVVKNTVRLSL